MNVSIIQELDECQRELKFHLMGGNKSIPFSSQKRNHQDNFWEGSFSLSPSIRHENGSLKKPFFNVYFAFQAILSILFFHEKCNFFGWDNKLGLQDPHELIRYWSPIYVLCVSSHFWPFTKANLVLENFNKNLGFGQTPPPLLGRMPNFFQKRILKAPLTSRKGSVLLQ